MKEYQKTLSLKDRLFADNYMGGLDNLRGNAARCYKHVHPRCKDSTASTEGPKILKKPHVVAYLREKADRIQKETDINAKWVLDESLRSLAIAFGDQPGIFESVVKTDSGEFLKVRHELCQTNLAAVNKALEVIGKNVNVQAFQDSVEVKHVDHESILNRRIKKIEAQAKYPPKLAASDGKVVDD